MKVSAGRILLLGHTGKLGRALARALAAHTLEGRSRPDCEANQPATAEALIAALRPDVLINTVAFQGIDACWGQPDAALQVNTWFPRALAQAAAAREIPLVHFSTECVFPDAAAGAAWTEADAPSPVNLYGLTKFGGEAFVRALAPRHYIIRLPLLFGEDPRASQFVERMLARARRGEPLAVSADVVTSPTYAADAAAAVAALLASGAPWGTYHVTNAGQATLHDLMRALLDAFGVRAELRAASHREFAARDIKNVNTPLASVRLPALRPWREAVAAFADDNRVGV